MRSCALAPVSCTQILRIELHGEADQRATLLFGRHRVPISGCERILTESDLRCNILRQFPERFKQKRPGMRPESIHLPGLSIHLVGPEPVAQVGIADSTSPHVNQDFRDVVGCHSIADKEAQQQLIVRSRTQAQVESCMAQIENSAREESRMWRHPSPIETGWMKRTGTPGSNDTAPVDLIYIVQVAIASGSVPGCKHFHNLAQDFRVGIEIVGVQEPHHIAGCQGDTLVHGVVNPPIGFGYDPVYIGAILADNGQRIVARITVDNQVFNRMSLFKDTVDAISDGCRTISNNRDNRYCLHRIISSTHYPIEAAIQRCRQFPVWLE
jgi:hypothetical protein